MKTNNDGGPAFPVANVIVSQPGNFTVIPEAQSGMSLRDYFAALAMQGLLSDESWADEPVERFGKTCYSFADSLLRAREAR